MKYRKWFSFLFFLGAAAVLWFIFKYNQVYSGQVKMEIEWNNIPVQLEINDTNENIINSELSGNGLKLLNATLFAPKVSLDFQQYVKNDSIGFYFVPNEALGAIKSSLNDDFKVEYLKSTKKYIDVNQFISKKVSLQKEFEVVYENNLQPLHDGYFEPDSVLITGNDQIVDGIDELEIKIPEVIVEDTLTSRTISLNNLFSDFKTSPNQIQYKVKAAVMTEGSFKIPVDVINVPQGVNLKIIPSSVEITYNCELKDYNLIDSSFFKVEIDYLKLENNFNSLVPNVIYKEELVSAVRHNPQQVQLITIE